MSAILHCYSHLGKIVMALTPCICYRKVNWLTIYKNQCFIAKNFTAETLLLGDSKIKGLIDLKELGTSISLTVLISASAEVALKMFCGELSTCQKCLI